MVSGMGKLIKEDIITPPKRQAKIIASCFNTFIKSLLVKYYIKVRLAYGIISANLMKFEKENKRIKSIDTIRGLAVVSMVIYHLLYDLIAIYKVLDIRLGTLYPFQQFICWTFILISGFSFNLSKNKLKSSLKLLALALAISLVTFIFNPSLTVRFGILHLLGSSGLILYFIQSGKFKLSKVLLYFGVFILFWILEPKSYPFYQVLSGLNIYPLGYANPSFLSSDYFPLIPWFFLYLTGYQLGGLALKNRLVLKKYDFNIKPLSFMGRYALKIYVLHQPILIALIEGYLAIK